MTSSNETLGSEEPSSSTSPGSETRVPGGSWTNRLNAIDRCSDRPCEVSESKVSIAHE